MQLLTAHRYSRGLAFLAAGHARPTTPAGRPAGTRWTTRPGRSSFAVARGAAQAAPGTDGARFAAALGIQASTVDQVAGAGRDEQGGAAAMVRALWPATVGYFLEQLAAPEVSAATVEARAAVHRRLGTPAWPAARLPGRCGARTVSLPVGAWSRWLAVPGEGVPARLPELLARLAQVGGCAYRGGCPGWAPPATRTPTWSPCSASMPAPVPRRSGAASASTPPGTSTATPAGTSPDCARRSSGSAGRSSPASARKVGTRAR